MTDFRIRFFSCVLVVVLTPFFSNAQTTKDIEQAKPWQLKSYGKKALAIGDVYSAIDYFEMYMAQRKQNMKIALTLAELHEKSRDYRMAASWYKVVFDSDPEKLLKAQFHLARMQQQLGDYASARQNFEAFYKGAKNLKDAKHYKKLTKMHLAGCAIAPKLLDSLLDVKVIHLDTSINKAHVEQNPLSLDDNTMLYVSLKADSIVKYDLNSDSIAQPVRQFYEAKKVEGHWVSSGLWKGPPTKPDVNLANGAFSPDRNRFYFTQCESNYKGEPHCSIWLSRKEGGKWSDPEWLNNGINDSKFSSTQPTVGTESSKNREVLYFISDRPEGRGGKDIWYAIYDPKAESFKEPRNAGSKVNTLADEMTPYYDNATKTLYFSSAGWPGLGGLDVFKTSGELKKFAPPANIGVPFNSSADDLYYNLETSREEGFLVSNREGGVALKNPTCCDDIYFFSWSDFVRLALEGTVSDNNPENPGGSVDGAIISLLIQDGESKEFLPLNRDTTEEDGYYFFEIEPGNKYKVTIEKPGYFTQTQSLNTTNVSASDTIQLRTSKMEILEEEKAIELQNIYFDFNSDELNAVTKQTLDTTLLIVMNNNPDLVIEVGSHTDTKGSADYNQKLSGRRAQAVVNYLTSKGISKKRLVGKGYGESEPRVKDENPDGTFNETAMQQNRRTEFKVTGRIKTSAPAQDD